MMLLSVAFEVWNVHHWSQIVKYTTESTLENDEQFDPELQKHIISVDDLVIDWTEKPLGAGAEGEVRKAEWRGAKVALKVASINQNFSFIGTRNLEAQVARELKEAQSEALTLFPLRHPNVVSVYGIAVHYRELDLNVITVVELCTTSLQDYIRDKKNAISFEEKLDLLKQIVSGMIYLHSENVMHRDLKPANVLLLKQEDRYVAKLADFGLS